MSQDVAAYIIADHRESNGANNYLQPAADYSNANHTKLPWKSGAGAIIPQILNNGAVGDYSIMIPSRHNPNRNILAAVFERKTWKDLAASIKDQRSITQHKNMLSIRDSKGCFIYYIIEGPLTYQDDTQIAHIAFKNLHAKMRCMSIRGVHSFQTRDQEDTARFLVNIARDLVRLYRQEDINFTLQEQPTINTFINDIEILITKYKDTSNPEIKSLLMSLEGESKKLTDQPELPEVGEQSFIPSEMTTRAEASHTDILLAMWCAVPKVSSKTAPILMEKFNLIDLLSVSDEKFIQSIRDNIANMSFASGTKIGIARADAIIGITYSGGDPGKTGDAYDAHVKILSSIPGVSTESADQILRKIPMRDLCTQIKSCIRTDPNETKKNLRTIVNNIATVSKRNGTKLGLAVAQKIIDVMSSTPRMIELRHIDT